MTDVELREAALAISSTYPKWMNKADAVATWEFRRLTVKANRLRVPARSLERWRMEARGLVRDYEDLELRVQGFVV